MVKIEIYKLVCDVTALCRHVRHTDCPHCCVTTAGIGALSDVFDLVFTQAIDEVRDFMKVNGVATKERQKLMRNLRVCLQQFKVCNSRSDVLCSVQNLCV